MKEFHVLAAALLLLLISLIVSGTGNVVSVSEDSTFDIYEESERLVALTFDDGPKAGMTEKLLDVLKEKGVKATFFMIGSQEEECPELVKRVAAEGHQIGIHTYSHVDLSCLTQEEQKEEIEKSIAAIESAIGTTELKLRPPFGKISGSLEAWLDMPLILWSLDTVDWKGTDAAQIIREAVRDVRDGDIILMHDISEHGAEAAAGMIDELQRMGYTFLTVDQLFACRGIELEDGEAYRRAR